MFKFLSVVLLFVLSLYDHGNVGKANFTDVEESVFLSIEDQTENIIEFLQQKADSSNEELNLNNSGINTIKKETEDILIEILLKIHEESEYGELPVSFIEGLLAHLYEIDSEQATETDFFQLIKYLSMYSKEVLMIHDHDLYKVDLTNLNEILSVLRNITKYVSKETIDIDPINVEKFLPLLRRYVIIENDTKLNNFQSNLIKVVKNTRNKNLSSWFFINEKKIVERDVENSDQRIRGKSLWHHDVSHVRGFLGHIINIIRGGGESLLEFALKLLEMLNLAFTEKANLVSLELFPITITQIRGECERLEEKVYELSLNISK